MKFCDEKIRKHLLNGGEIKRNDDEFWFNFRHIKLIDDVLRFTDDKNEPYEISRGDLLADDWEIVEVEYDWNKIIEDKVLCVFSDAKDFESGVVISVLKRKNDNCYYNSREMPYKYCKPFNPADYNIVKDLKEYEK